MQDQLINEIGLTMMPNDNHMQFHTDFMKLVEEEGTDNLDVETLWQDRYLPWYERETEALDLVRGNTQATALDEYETARDHVVRGFFKATKSFVTHFNVDKRNVAGRLQVVLNTYKGLPDKGDDDQTAATADMLAELRQPANAADIEALGLGDWLPEIEASNNTYVGQKKLFYDETADKTELRMKPVRVGLNDAYHAVIARIEALALLGDATKYKPFARKLNARIDHYRNIIKLRQGQRAAKKDKDDEKSDEG